MPIPFVMINLDRPYKLRFGMGAMVEFEQLTNIKLMDISDEMSVDAAAKLLWVMLRQEDPGLGLKQVCDLVDEHADSITDVMNTITTAIEAAFNSGETAPNA